MDFRNRALRGTPLHLHLYCLLHHTAALILAGATVRHFGSGHLVSWLLHWASISYYHSHHKATAEEPPCQCYWICPPSWGEGAGGTVFPFSMDAIAESAGVWVLAHRTRRMSVRGRTSEQNVYRFFGVSKELEVHVCVRRCICEQRSDTALKYLDQLPSFSMNSLM
jgi:hypothetical protein